MRSLPPHQLLLPFRLIVAYNVLFLVRSEVLFFNMPWSNLLGQVCMLALSFLDKLQQKECKR